jgi:hypothetical protein
MNSPIIQSMTLLAWAVLFGTACAEPLPSTDAGEPQDIALAASPANDSASASPTDAFRRMAPPEIAQAVRCESREGSARDACRAKLAAKYAKMDKLCRVVSGTEIPVCIKSAYAPD